MPEHRRGNSLYRAAAIVAIALGLVACGDVPDTGTEVTPPVPLSPTAGEIPEQTFLATAAISEGSLDPDRFAGQIGTAFELEIEGDGTEHTLMIDQMVAEMAIAAEGTTTVAFTIVGEPGLADILLDGEVAGAFERQSTGGITSP